MGDSLTPRYCQLLQSTECTNRKLRPMAAVKMYYLALLILTCQMACGTRTSFRILALVPYYGETHWFVVQPLLEELAKRGNDVTVVSHHPRKTFLQNYHDFSISTGASTFLSREVSSIGSKSHYSSLHDYLSQGVDQVCKQALSHPVVQNLINSNQTFDLIISELFHSDCFLGFVHKFKAPLVALKTSSLSPWSNSRLANPDNPSYIPTSSIGYPTRMTFFQRLNNLFTYILYPIVYSYYSKQGTNIARRHFGPDMPSLDVIARNTSLLLVNSHFVLQYARPLVPGVKEIAGIHIKPNKSLPKDLDDWISGADHGVIYFSLGSMLKASSMDETKREAFLKAFAALPQRVLMKWEGEPLENLPQNVKSFTWVPQYDILCHHNVKLFISHAGMLSTIEAVYSATPMISIPAYGDQLTNAALLEELGISIKIDYSSITKEILLKTLRKVLYDSRFELKAREMSLAIRDRLVEPVEEAAYWTEYVARHRGGPLLRTPAAELPLYQYLLLDVFATLLVTMFVVLWIFCYLVRLMFSLKRVKSFTMSGRKKIN